MNHSFFQRMHDHDQAQIEVDEVLKKRIEETLRLPGMERRGRTPFFSRLSSFWGPLGGLALATAAIALFFLLPQTFSSTNSGLMNLARSVDDWTGDSAQMESATGVQTTGNSSFRQGGMPAGLNSPSIRNIFEPANQPASIQAAPTPTGLHDMRATDAQLGFSVGGAKDINTFRENIHQGYLPQENDVTYEGLFYDYSFDTGHQEPCRDLFCPSYSRAVSRHPLTGQDEYYLSVGLNSNLDQRHFQRQKTNFVVVLDISGSMAESFASVEGRAGTKMEMAKHSLNLMIDQLKPEDRLGIVLFSDEAHVAKPLRLVSQSDLKILKQHISQLRATNGTNMSAGLERGRQLLQEGGGDEAAQTGYANRLIFITDAMPNEGEFGSAGLAGLVQRNADQGIGMTFIGVGVDFQTNLVEGLTKVRGANYVSVHSAQDFTRTLGKDFDLLESPLVYDLKLSAEGSGFAIDKIYGDPDADLSQGNLMHIRTLFPSRTENGQARGGVILLKLRKLNTSETLGDRLNLHVTYQDTHGQSFYNDASVSFDGLRDESFDSNGVRKAVLLSRYGELLKQWLKNEHGDLMPSGGDWNRAVRPLRVSNPYPELFKKFTPYFQAEARAIQGWWPMLGNPVGSLNDFSKELTVLDKLSTLSPPQPIQPLIPAPRYDDWEVVR